MGAKETIPMKVNNVMIAKATQTPREAMQLDSQASVETSKCHTK